MLTSAPRSSVLSVENLNIMITNTPRRVNMLIMCKLMILIIGGIVEDVHIPSEVTSNIVDELVKCIIPTFDETHVQEEGINDV